MSGVEFAPLLASLFLKSDRNAVKVYKILKKASKHSSLTDEHLRASLDAFLRGHGGFRLEGRSVVKVGPARQQEGQDHQQQQEKAKVKKKKKKAKVEPSVAAAEATAAVEEGTEVAAQRPKQKQRKKQGQGTEGGAGSGHPAQQAPAGALAAGSSKEKQNKKKKKKKKRKAGSNEEEEVGEQREQQTAQEPAAGEQQQQQQAQERPAKRRKKASGGSSGGAAAAAEAAAGGAGEGAAFDDDPPLLRWRDSQKRQDVKHGPFSKEEKDTIRQAVHEYAAKHGLSTDSYDWLFVDGRGGGKHSKKMWINIAASLPHRNIKAVWAAGTRMFHEGNYLGKWRAEEDEKLMQLVAERGRKWKEIGAAVGRMPETCRDRWLSIRQGEARNRGRWSDEETERLRQAVNDYLAAKTVAEAAGARQEGGGSGDGEGMATLTLADIEGAIQDEGEGGSDDGAAASVLRRMVLDDINWTVVSQAVGTRSNIQCLEKWYTQLSPSMVARGEWGSGDDRRLLRALYLSGAEHDYELDWGQLVKGRTAQQARRRWRLMAKAVPDHRDLEFGQVVDALVDRFLPLLKQAQQEQGAEVRQADADEEVAAS